MLMQASHAELDISFPQKYLQKLERYRKQRSELFPKLRRKRKPSDSPKILNSHCKQGISLAKAKIYCCILKEPMESQMCKVCPCHEPEPLEYALYKRV